MPMDLRSDTITQPTPAMSEAMARAEVGNDVFGDDPTVARLETRTAEILCKEAAVFTPSGTMANQLALRAHTEPGDEILVDANSHIYYCETGAPAALAGVRVLATGPDTIRAVTNLMVSPGEIPMALGIFKSTLESVR